MYLDKLIPLWNIKQNVLTYKHIGYATPFYTYLYSNLLIIFLLSIWLQLFFNVLWAFYFLVCVLGKKPAMMPNSGK